MAIVLDSLSSVNPINDTVSVYYACLCTLFNGLTKLKTYQTLHPRSVATTATLLFDRVYIGLCCPCIVVNVDSLKKNK